MVLGLTRFTNFKLDPCINLEFFELLKGAIDCVIRQDLEEHPLNYHYQKKEYVRTLFHGFF